MGNSGLISIVVPAHNEEAEIGEALQKLTVALSSLDYHIIVVDDGSTDSTLEIAQSLSGPRLKVLTHKPNRGKGYAVKKGLRECTTEYVGYLDGDLDLDPSAIVHGLELLRNSPNVDGAIGSKLHRKSEIEYSKIRKTYSLLYRTLVRLLFRTRVSDTQTGLKVFRKSATDSCLDEVTSNGWAFDLELIVRLEELGFSLVEIPIKLDYKFSSNISIASISRALSDTLVAFYEIKIRRSTRL